MSSARSGRPACRVTCRGDSAEPIGSSARAEVLTHAKMMRLLRTGLLAIDQGPPEFILERFPLESFHVMPALGAGIHVFRAQTRRGWPGQAHECPARFVLHAAFAIAAQARLTRRRCAARVAY